MPNLPEARITVFSDYICPFCYVGNARINRLRKEFNIKVNWRFVEIHPETPAAGNNVSDLQYDDETWAKMMSNLNSLLIEEHLDMSEIKFVANSHYALRLAEAAKTEGTTIFYTLHEALFRAYFIDGNDIGDIPTLANIAQECGVSDSLFSRVINNKQYAEFLTHNLRIATEVGVRSVPSMRIGEKMLHGISSISTMRDAILASS